jgi:hypothetical protein
VALIIFNSGANEMLLKLGSKFKVLCIFSMM